MFQADVKQYSHKFRVLGEMTLNLKFSKIYSGKMHTTTDIDSHVIASENVLLERRTQQYLHVSAANQAS